MAENGLNPKPRRRHVATTDSNHDGPISPDIARRFEVHGPDRLRIADITCVAIATGASSVSRSPLSSDRWRTMVRSGRWVVEQMRYNLLFRWFVGLGIDDPVWVATVFTRNRDRLLTTAMSRKPLAAILAHREVAPLLSDAHFPVDGRLVKAWASMKIFQPKTENPPPDGDGPDDPPPPAATATPKSTSAAGSARTPPMPRPPIRMRGSTGSHPAPGSASWAMP